MDKSKLINYLKIAAMALISGIKRIPILVIWFVIRLIAKNSLITNYGLKFLRNRPILKGRLYRIYQFRTRLLDIDGVDIDNLDNINNFSESTLLIYNVLNRELDKKHYHQG